MQHTYTETARASARTRAHTYARACARTHARRHLHALPHARAAACPRSQVRCAEGVVYGRTLHPDGWVVLRDEAGWHVRASEPAGATVGPTGSPEWLLVKTLTPALARADVPVPVRLDAAPEEPLEAPPPLEDVAELRLQSQWQVLPAG